MRYILPILLSISLLMGCSDDQERQNCTSGPNANNLPCEYSYELTLSCFCAQDYLGPHFLHIRDGEIIDYENLNNSDASWDSITLTSFRIERFIEYVEEIENSSDGSISNLEYHDTYNFPSKGNLDFIIQAADDELGFEIQHFKVY